MNSLADVCPCCKSGCVDRVATIPFYSAGGSVSSDIYYCRECRTYRRRFQQALRAEDHYEIASYTREGSEIENRARLDRMPFFSQILGLAGDPGFLLDVGCAYGHLMELASTCGWQCHGIEIVERLRRRLNADPRFETFASVDELPAASSYNAIALIDSLYYFDPPEELLVELRRKLTGEGRLIIRITNRSPLLSLRRKIGLTVDNRSFGDQIFAFSHLGLTRLLSRCGLAVEKVVLREHKKIPMRQASKWIYYNVMPIVSNVTRLKLTPGIIYVCRRAQ